MSVNNFRKYKLHWSGRRLSERRVVNLVREEQVGGEFNDGVTGEWVNFLTGYGYEESDRRIDGNCGGNFDRFLELQEKGNHVLGGSSETGSTTAESVERVKVIDGHSGVVLVVIRISIVELPAAVLCGRPRHVTNIMISTSINVMLPKEARVSTVVVVEAVGVDGDLGVQTLSNQRRVDADGECVVVEACSYVDWSVIGRKGADVVEDAVKSRVDSGLAIPSSVTRAA